MILHLLRGRWCTILCPPSGTQCNLHNTCILGAVHDQLLELTHLQWYTMLPLVHLMQFPSVLPDTVTISEVLT